MVAFTLLALAAATALAAPATDKVALRDDANVFIGPDHFLSRRFLNITGRSNTNYNQNYHTGGTVNYTPGTNQFSVNWNTQNDFVVGVGWQPGSTT